jgi:hypothetical protein
MSLTRKNKLAGSSSLRRWWPAAIALFGVATVLIVLTGPAEGPAAEPVPPPSTGPTPRSSATAFTGPQSETPTAAPPAVDRPDAGGAPRTTDFRKLASAAARAIYTWDTRTASYSEVMPWERWAVVAYPSSTEAST